MPNNASVELIYTLGGVVCENVFHIDFGFPPQQADLFAARLLIDSKENARLTNVRSLSVVLNRIKLRALDSPSAPVHEYTLVSPRSGIFAAAAPNNVTFAIKATTGYAGRSQRGRWYWVGVAGDGVVNGTTLLQARATQYVTALNNFKNDLATGGFTMTVVSFRSNKAWRSEGQALPIQSFVAVDLNLDSMRRRLVGRGSP